MLDKRSLYVIDYIPRDSRSKIIDSRISAVRESENVSLIDRIA